jgi:hypothetical protein
MDIMPVVVVVALGRPDGTRVMHMNCTIENILTAVRKSPCL